MRVYGSSSITLGRVQKSATSSLAQRRSVYRLRQVHEADFAESLQELARAGLGVVWLPRRLVAADLDSGTLVPADEAGREIGLEVRVYRRRASTKSLTREIWTAA
jgi:DNA-binding transcriptional LysR family regulator